MPDEPAAAAHAPEHEVRPLDPTSPDAANLRSLGERFHTDVDRQFETDLRITSASGSIEDPRLQLVRRADAYALNLREYWSRAVAFANDGYRYGSHGGERELRDLNGALKDVDQNLGTQLQKWEEVTSPYSDRYDVGEIFSTGQELLVTLRNASKDHAAKGDLKLDDPQATAEAAFNVMIGAALAGLSKEIGDRLSALGAGETVERVTMTSQTKEILDRAATDPEAEKMKSDAGTAEAFRDDFIKNRWTGDRIIAMRTTSRELAEKLRADDVAPDDRRKLETQRDEIEKTLQSLDEAIDAVEKSRPQREKIQDARAALSAIDRKLVTRKMTPEDRTELLTDRESKVKALADLEEPFLSGALEVAKTQAADSQDRLERYTERLDEARSEARTDPAAYWDTLHSQFLDEVEAAVSKDLRKTLDDALQLSEALKGWKKQLAPKATLDPAKLQDAAANVLRTIDACSERAKLATRDADADAAVLEALRDELNAGLAAIRESVANNLTFLFKSGVFGRAA